MTPETDAPFGRAKNGVARTSAYFAIIGEPPVCGPGDHAPALAYLHKIDEAMTRGGWSEYEHERLRKLRVTWERRAFGRDPRFELAGTRGGRLKAEDEHAIRHKRARALRGTRPPQDQRCNPERRWTVDADLPTRKARGFSGTVDPNSDNDPEPGEIELPTIPPARQYLIPGQDTKGHAHRVYCRVMPAHYRALAALERSKVFGFRTIGDAIRWCVDFGVRELAKRQHVPGLRSALAQVDVIREILNDELYYQEFGLLFEQMTATVNRHLRDGAEAQAVKLIARVRYEIEQMAEEFWRDKFMGELMRLYGSYLDGSHGGGVEFGGE